MSGAINNDAYVLYNKVKIMILKWRKENPGRMPKYLFLSERAYFLLANSIDALNFHYSEVKTFDGIEIAHVGVPGIYAAIGEEF